MNDVKDINDVNDVNDEDEMLESVIRSSSVVVLCCVPSEERDKEE